jgi:hypothetical protein
MKNFRKINYFFALSVKNFAHIKKNTYICKKYKRIMNNILLHINLLLLR